MKGLTMRLLAALAVLAALSSAAVAAEGTEAEAKQTCPICSLKDSVNKLLPGVTWGADLRLRALYDEARTLDQHATGHDRFWSLYRARVWTKITPVENVDFNIRVVTEPRVFCRPDMEEQTIRQEALFDLLNVKWSKVLGTPLTLTAGRQELKFGDGWLVINGTPLDGTRTLFFDAVRATYDAQAIKTVFDLVTLCNQANSSAWIRPFNDRNLDLAENDEIGVILYGSNKSVKDTTIDGYFMYKNDDRVAENGDDADIYTLGARAAGALDEHWKYVAEAAPQWGHKNGVNICAFGANSDLAYNFNDPHKNLLHSGYEFKSGSGERDGSFDPLWGRYPIWSNLYADSIAGLEFLPDQVSNLHRLTTGWGFNPCQKMTFTLDYSLLFANQNTFADRSGFSEEGKFRGQLIKSVLEHVMNEHLTGQVIAELFAPGNYYDDTRNDVALFLRYQLTVTW